MLVNTSFRDHISNILNFGVKLCGFGEFGHGLHEYVFTNFSLLDGLFGGIFLEIPADFQDSIDHYLKTKIIDDKFEKLLFGASAENKNFRNTYTSILDYAINNNIPVVCIDSSKTKTAEYTKSNSQNSSYLRGNSRDEDMFKNIMDILDKTSKPWCLICHAAHLDYMFDMSPNDPSLGKRLKKILEANIFSICLFYIENSTFKYYLSNEINNEFTLPIPSKPYESFDAVIVHP